MSRNISPVTKLAIRFYIEILGHTDFSDQRLFRRYCTEAQRLCRPRNGDRPLDPEIVWGTIQCLPRLGYSGKVTSMHIVTWGNPPYYEQYLSYLNTPPPHWNLAEVRAWEKETGRVAYPGNPIILISVPVVLAHIPQSESL